MKMKLDYNYVLVMFVLLSMGCNDPTHPQATSSLLDPKGAFTLYVSNQSFAVNPVDVHVEIDGEIVVRDYFWVETQHTFVPFQMNLAQGPHKIRIWSEKEAVKLTKKFDLKDHDIGIVQFWYYDDSHYDPTPRSFSFSTQKGPLIIE